MNKIKPHDISIAEKTKKNKVNDNKKILFKEIDKTSEEKNSVIQTNSETIKDCKLFLKFIIKNNTKE